MAYLMPCQCEALGLGSKPPTCCECGKLGRPAKGVENFNDRNKRLAPIREMLEINRKEDLRQYVENTAEIKKIDSLARFQTKVQMEERRMELEVKSERLKRQMEQEMYEYTKEITDDFSKRQNSKIEEMRERVKMLKEKREAEEKKLVDKKLDLVFQSQCDPMRTLMTKRGAKEIVKDWDEQIKMKARLECEEEENERMYTYLSKLDCENKWRREQAYLCTRAKTLKDGLDELNRQVASKKSRAAELAIINARELAMNEQIQKDLEEERQKREAEKYERFIKAKDHVKDMIATKSYYRDRRLKREEIVGREFLKKAIRELYIEQEDRNKAKRELRRSIEIYIDYLKKRDCYNNARELEIQQIIDGVIEEQYIKKYEIRRKELQQRRKLLCNVIAGRGQQMDDLKAKHETEEMERQKEIELLKEEWKEYLREVEEEKEEKVQKQMQYRRDLDCQLDYIGTVQGRNSGEANREREMCKLEEGFFQNRLDSTIKQATFEKSNPYRELLVGKTVKQILRPVGCPKQTEC